jgi:hypothetical protein
MAKKPTKAQKKVEKVMSEYPAGTLKSSSGQKVTNRKQAIAIALSEAGKARKKPTKKGGKK